MDTRYRLAPGVQVREECFGLLFYSMNGPRLYFLPSRELLTPHFFSGDQTLRAWIENRSHGGSETGRMTRLLKQAMDKLKAKGVVVEC